MKLKLTYLFLIIIAIMAGYFLGNICAGTSTPSVSWLGATLTFGFEPFTLKFNAFDLTLGLQLAINPLEILFILLAIVLAPKVADAIKTK